jgi:quercetin dioxygenase-like cupin family protein
MFASIALALVSGSLALQGDPRQGFATTVDDQARALGASGRPYLPFLSAPTMTCGVYRLAAGAEDGQSPHRLDEVYVVTAGKATLVVGGQRFEAKAGSILFVPAWVEHRFVDIEEDLTTLVFFSTATPTTGGMAAGPPPQGVQTRYPETSARGSTRVFYWGRSDSAGQVEIDYGVPQYQPAYARFLAEPSGQRWRFGQDFWTRLDSNLDLTIGGVELPAGYYYLVLENTKEHGVRLIALDPIAVRQRKLDAFEAPRTTGGIAIPLKAALTANPSERLSIALSVDRSKDDAGALEIVFGPHRFTAEVEFRRER